MLFSYESEAEEAHWKMINICEKRVSKRKETFTFEWMDYVQLLADLGKCYEVAVQRRIGEGIFKIF